MALEDVSSEQLQPEMKADDSIDVDVADEVDFVTYYEQAAGRLVVDPEYVIVGRAWPTVTHPLLARQAKVEFGEVMASRLKLSPDGSKVLWPQPANDPNDPQNARHFSLSCPFTTLNYSFVVVRFSQEYALDHYYNVCGGP
jgi:hypothetical protein